MKLSQLLQQREALLRQSRLSNLAFAYWHLANLVTRIARTGLRGQVRLQSADPGSECHWPELTALAGSQSVIEEHFTDENILELSDLISFLTDDDRVDRTFRLEDMAEDFLAPLQLQLRQAGVEFEPDAPRLAGPDPAGPDWQ